MEAESVTYISTEDQEQITFIFPAGIREFATTIGASLIVIQNGELNYVKEGGHDWLPYPEAEEPHDGPHTLSVIKRKN